MTGATATNQIDEALKQYGVTETTLALGERAALDRDGYVGLTGIVNAEWLEGLRAAFEKSCAGDRQAAQSGNPRTPQIQASQSKETGTRHIDDLVNSGPVFEFVYTHPKVLAAVHHVLGAPFRLGQMNGRDPLPGFGQQGLHADWRARAKGEPFRIVTTIWLLDDFTCENGATRLVPGTHLLLAQPPKSFADPASRHPDQKLIVAGAGSVLIFNGHIWHSGTRNNSNQSRRVLQASYVGRDEVRFGSIKIKNPERLSPAARYVLGASMDAR